VAELLGDLLGERGDLHRGAVQRELARLDERVVEEILDHPGEAAGRLADLVCATLQQLVVARALGDQLRREEDAAERLAEVVGDDRVPLRAQPLELAERGDVLDRRHRADRVSRVVADGGRGGADRDLRAVGALDDPLVVIERLARERAAPRGALGRERTAGGIEEPALVGRGREGPVGGVTEELERVLVRLPGGAVGDEDADGRDAQHRAQPIERLLALALGATAPGEIAREHDHRRPPFEPDGERGGLDLAALAVAPEHLVLDGRGGPAGEHGATTRGGLRARARTIEVVGGHPDQRLGPAVAEHRRERAVGVDDVSVGVEVDAVRQPGDELAELRLRAPQGGLGLTLVGDVLELRDEVGGGAVGVAHERPAQHDVDGGAVFPEVALVEAVVRDLAARELPREVRVEVEVDVLGVGDALKGALRELVGGVAGDLAQRAVHAQEAPVETDEPHADRRLLEREAEALFALGERARDGLALAVEARVVERDRRLIGERREQLLVVARGGRGDAAVGGEDADGLAAEDERRRGARAGRPTAIEPGDALQHPRADRDREPEVHGQTVGGDEAEALALLEEDGGPLRAEERRRVPRHRGEHHVGVERLGDEPIDRQQLMRLSELVGDGGHGRAHGRRCSTPPTSSPRAPTRSLFAVVAWATPRLFRTTMLRALSRPGASAGA